jgi:two-component system, response regulator
MNRVLMIEDNEDDVELACRTFEKAGLTGKVRVVRNGEEAIDCLFARGAYAQDKNDPPVRLILLDLKLPKMSGLDVLRQIRLHPATRDIPVVILTVSRQEPDLLQSFMMGVSDYLIKPLDADHFAQIYRKYVGETPS